MIICYLQHLNCKSHQAHEHWNYKVITNIQCHIFSLVKMPASVVSDSHTSFQTQPCLIACKYSQFHHRMCPNCHMNIITIFCNLNLYIHFRQAAFKFCTINVHVILKKIKECPNFHIINTMAKLRIHKNVHLLSCAILQKSKLKNCG